MWETALTVDSKLPQCRRRLLFSLRAKASKSSQRPVALFDAAKRHLDLLKIVIL